MPRPYRLGSRKASADETRARIVAGARELLMSEDGFTHFTMDAIARVSGVARMTVYYQFQSKTGVYEALADDLAARGKIAENIGKAFTAVDSRAALAKLIAAFVHFWMADADAMRKLHALTVLDPESRAEERNSRRREAIERTLRSLQIQQKVPTRARMQPAVDTIFMLTGFAATDELAQLGYSEREIARTLCAMAAEAVGIDLTI
jgi:AcrR family transcriptional regulator